jgi:hypothetical protein
MSTAEPYPPTSDPEVKVCFAKAYWHAMDINDSSGHGVVPAADLGNLKDNYCVSECTGEPSIEDVKYPFARLRAKVGLKTEYTAGVCHNLPKRAGIIALQDLTASEVI